MWRSRSSACPPTRLLTWQPAQSVSMSLNLRCQIRSGVPYNPLDLLDYFINLRVAFVNLRGYRACIALRLTRMRLGVAGFDGKSALTVSLACQ